MAGKSTEEESSKIEEMRRAVADHDQRVRQKITSKAQAAVSPAREFMASPEFSAFEKIVADAAPKIVRFPRLVSMFDNLTTTMRLIKDLTDQAEQQAIGEYSAELFPPPTAPTNLAPEA